jgi:hypothetical protein
MAQHLSRPLFRPNTMYLAKPVPYSQNNYNSRYTIVYAFKMSPNQREIQRQLMKKYNIVFDGPIDSIANPQWPSTCNTIFEHIRQLGRTDYSQYRESISADFQRSPWRYQVQRRAKRITEKAKLCIESRKNESGWRLSLESEVMARFSVEIAW